MRTTNGNVQLVNYDAARRALEEAIKDKMVSLVVYARQLNDRAMEQRAMEIRFRAERRFGALLKETAKTKQRRGVGHPKKEYSSQHDHSSPRKLKELGLTKDQSSQYQQMAAIPDEEFEIRLAHAKRDPRSASTQKMLKPVPEPFEEPEPWKRVDIWARNLLAYCRFEPRCIRSSSPRPSYPVRLPGA